jgi:hypothetical protein
MQRKKKITAESQDRFCPWCETKYRPAPETKVGPLCPDCRAELMEQPKEFLVDMLARVAGVNAITMASLREEPDILEGLLPWNAPNREGFTRRRLTMKELTRNRQRVQ